jgi:multisubunit Na+/H+ antiporter MnhF subunit
MNEWLWAAACLLALEAPLLLYAALASRLDALVALEAGGSIGALALIALAEGFHRTAYTIVGVVACVLAFAGGMVFVRFFEQDLDV